MLDAVVFEFHAVLVVELLVDPMPDTAGGWRDQVGGRVAERGELSLFVLGDLVNEFG